MLSQSRMMEEIKEFFSCSGCKKLQKSGNILMCSHLICTDCLPPSSTSTHFHCPACKRETIVTPHAFYGLDKDNIQRSCKKFQKNFNQFAEEQDAALGDYLDDKIREIEKKYAEKIKALMSEKETEIKKLKGEHTKQMSEVTNRNSKVREILTGAIENNSGSSSESVSDSSPPPSPTPLSPIDPPAPLSPREEQPESGATSEEVGFPRMINQRRNRQGDRRAFKGRRGGNKAEESQETCRILTPSPEYICNNESEEPGTCFKEGGIHMPTAMFGKRGTNPDQFKYPRGVAIDSSGDIFVVDSESPCIRVWSSEGVFKSAFGNVGTAKNEFGSPWGISIYQGKVYVTDIEKHSVFVYKTTGKFITSFGKEGNSLNCLREPRGIFTSEDGDIYVADSENNRVQVFSESLKHKCFIGEELVKPRDVFVDEKGSVYVLDCGSTCIHVFSSEGGKVKEFGAMGNEHNMVIQPCFFTMDKFGQIIVSDGKAYKQEHNLKVFGSEGQFKFSVGAKGGKPGMFVLPRGIRVNSEGRLVVSDSVNHRVQIF